MEEKKEIQNKNYQFILNSKDSKANYFLGKIHLFGKTTSFIKKELSIHKNK